MSPRAEVLTVPHGGLLILSNVQWGNDAGVPPEDAVAELHRVIGHDQWALVTLGPSSSAEVWGPDVDLMAKVRELLDQPVPTLPGSMVPQAILHDDRVTITTSAGTARIEPGLWSTMQGWPPDVLQEWAAGQDHDMAIAAGAVIRGRSTS